MLVAVQMFQIEECIDEFEGVGGRAGGPQFRIQRLAVCFHDDYYFKQRKISLIGYAILQANKIYHSFGILE